MSFWEGLLPLRLGGQYLPWYRIAVDNLGEAGKLLEYVPLTAGNIFVKDPLDFRQPTKQSQASQTTQGKALAQVKK